MKSQQIDREQLARGLETELQRFSQSHPRSKALSEKAGDHMPYAVPMPWMMEWPGAFPIFALSANGARLTDVDGHEYVDFCLGDTGAMTGHSPAAALEGIQARMEAGITHMLPTEDAIWVSAELERRFRLPYWQYALTATDANRFAINISRHLTRRNTILVFNYCYHGTVEQTYFRLQGGEIKPRYGSLLPAQDPGVTTRLIEFNDVPALEAALAQGDVACVVAEPALTNIGIVLPVAGYHAALREITRQSGTLLIIDETHTLSAGPGGYTAAFDLEPDILTLGKPMGSGIPCAAYGFSREIGRQLIDMGAEDYRDISGVGGTLAANALSLAAARYTLQHVLTEQAYAHMISLGARFERGVKSVIEEFGLPWHVTRLGCRAEYWFCDPPPRNGGQASASFDQELNAYMHLAALNRGILLTPFHNMALMSPATSEEDVDLHTQVFRASVSALLDPGG